MTIFGKVFTDHPHHVGETYWKHLRFTIRMSYQLIRAGICCLLHGIFPLVHQTTTSRSLRKMNQEMRTRLARPRRPRPKAKT